MSRTLHELIEQLAGSEDAQTSVGIESVGSQSDLVDPVYVEKLASAVDFLSDNVESLVLSARIPEREKVASADFPSSIRNSLREKLAAASAAKRSDEPDLDAKALDSILSRLRGLNPEETEDIDETDNAVLDDAFSVEDNESDSVDAEEVDDSEEEELGGTMKAASSKLSLADMLRNALGNAEEPEGSADTASVKTSSVIGNGLTKQEAAVLLRSKLSSDLVI